MRYDIMEIDGYQFPKELIKLRKLGLTNMEFWWLIDDEHLQWRYKHLKQYYKNRQLIPFAKRDDCDDIACFEVGKGETVQIIHDFASPGWEQVREYNCFWDWFSAAISEMVDSEDYNDFID